MVKPGTRSRVRWCGRAFGGFQTDADEKGYSSKMERECFKRVPNCLVALNSLKLFLYRKLG